MSHKKHKKQKQKNIDQYRTEYYQMIGFVSSTPEWVSDGDFFKKLSIYDTSTQIKTSSSTTLNAEF